MKFRKAKTFLSKNFIEVEKKAHRSSVCSFLMFKKANTPNQTKNMRMYFIDVESKNTATDTFFPVAYIELWGHSLQNQGAIEIHVTVGPISHKPISH
jgi:hypothetical protein